MRVVHAQHMSCRDACVAHAAMVNCQTVGVRAGLHTNLADERERVERAGMVQMHHDGVVHDGQAPPAASSSHGACARPASFPPPVCSTREVSSKLAAGSSSSAAVGETVARHAIEPRSSHGRHGGRERRGQLPCRREAPSWRSFLVQVQCTDMRRQESFLIRPHGVCACVCARARVCVHACSSRGGCGLRWTPSRM